MSDNCIHIIPVHEGDYPDAERKAFELLAWFRERDMVEAELSDCTLGKPGYRFKPAITAIAADVGQVKEFFRLDLLTLGLELHFERRTVFHPMEGVGAIRMTCGSCGHEHDDARTGEFLLSWIDATDDFPRCAGCGRASHITTYSFEDSGHWGFSNLGITLWNFDPDLNSAFLVEMRAIYGTEEIRVVNVRI